MADLITITVDSSDVVRATQYTNELTAANDRLEKELKPLLAKEKEFQRAIRQVNEAMRLNVITNKQAIAQVAALGKQYGYTQQQIDRATASMNGIRKNTNRMNATIQNAGYQFGDFFVQMQSGQNILVAFSQQGAQLAGLLPGLRGAVLGVGLVVGSMLVRALLDGTGAMKSLEDAVEEITSSLTKFAGSVRKVAAGFRDELGPEVKKFADAVLRQDLNEALEAVEKNVGKFTGTFSKLQREINLATKAAGVEIASGRPGEAVSRLEELKAVKEQILSLSKVDPSNVEDLREAIATITDLINKDLGSGLEFSEKAMKALRDLGISFEDVLDSLVPEVEETANSLADGEDSLANMVVRSRELVGIFNQLQTLSGNIDESFKRTAIQASLVTEGMSKGMAGQIASMRIMLEKEMEKATELYGADFAGGLLSGRAAQLKQFELNLQSMATSSRSGGGGGSRSPLDAQVEAYKKFQKNIDDTLVSYRKQANLELKLIGMSKEEAKLTEFIFDFEKKLGATREQLSADQQAQYDAIIEAKKKEIELTKQQKLEEEKLAEAKKKVEAVASTLASETVGALRDIVNGTKTASQAFRDMAINIIQQIMNILIWQPLIESLTNSISGAISGSISGGGSTGNILGSIFGFQKGGAFSAGNIVPFAYGGVVNSPTMFGMSGGRTGLMGEAGPEAIMPLKRGPNGKLGVEGGGNVTVNQTFNFAANGDESVKKIIAEAAPRIAKMTEAQIINSRQRGGQMRRAFG